MLATFELDSVMFQTFVSHLDDIGRDKSNKVKVTSNIVFGVDALDTAARSEIMFQGQEQDILKVFDLIHLIGQDK